MTRGRTIILLWSVALGLVVIGAAGWIVARGFEPGAGGADQPAPVVGADGAVHIELRLTVWGGGGPIHGRYTHVVMRLKPVGTERLQVLPGALVRSEAAAETYAFDVSHASTNVAGPIDYNFEVTLDGHTTRIPGKYPISLRG